MADQLNMGALNLGPDGAPQGGQPQQPRSYIPPHMRSRPGGPPAPAPGPAPGQAPNGPAVNGAPPAPANGLGNSAWAK